MKSVLRPLSPETSVEKFSKENSEEKKGMSGFRAMFIVSKLMQSRKTKFEERRASLGRAKKNLDILVDMYAIRGGRTFSLLLNKSTFFRQF